MYGKMNRITIIFKALFMNPVEVRQQRDAYGMSSLVFQKSSKTPPEKASFQEGTLQLTSKPSDYPLSLGARLYSLFKFFVDIISKLWKEPPPRVSQSLYEEVVLSSPCTTSDINALKFLYDFLKKILQLLLKLF